MEAGKPQGGVRLADLVAAFSLASDLGLGQPMEHILRAWWIAAQLAALMGLDELEREALFYVTTLGWVGCVADTPEVAAWFGDDIAYRRDSFGVDRAPIPMLGFALRHVGAGGTTLHRVRLGAALVATGGAGVQRGLMSHCLTTARFADRLGLRADVSDWLQQVFARWDGRGVPRGLRGDAIARSVRLFHVADTVEVMHRGEGVDAAVRLSRSWRGKQFDPAVVDLFCGAAGDVLRGVDAVTEWESLITQEPRLRRRVDGDDLDDALTAIADFTDLRSPLRAGHSRAVAQLAARAGELSRMPSDEVTRLRRAALLHDVGLHGVPASILDKPGPLTASESERMRMHAYYTERMLARPATLAHIGAIAAMANERMDGSGYHRGLSGAAIPAAGRILAAADAYVAMLEPRSYRPAASAGAATDALCAEARAGRLAMDAVDAVLTAAGQRRSRRRESAAGLTSREVEVLRLIAAGCSTKQVAQTLRITARTAGTHIEHIYSKIGASTRSTATLFALQHGLLDLPDTRAGG